MQFRRLAQVLVNDGLSLIALRVRDLRVVFEVKKDATTACNQAKVAVYNLSADHRAFIRELGQPLVLSAGYENQRSDAQVPGRTGGADLRPIAVSRELLYQNGLEEVFNGKLVSVYHQKEGPDWVTRLEANDGQTALRDQTVGARLSFVEGVTLKKVLAETLKQLGLPVGFKADFADQQFAGGFAFAGPAKEALDLVTARAGLEWSVQSGKVKLLKLGSTDGQLTALVDPESGLVGSPERLTRLMGAQGTTKPPGWNVTCLLRPQVEPGSQLAFRSRDVPRATAFRVENVLHKGDTHGKDWTTVAEVLDPGTVLP